MENTRLRRLMDSTTSLLACLFVFTVRVTITVWSPSGFRTRAYCIAALLACVIGVITNLVAQRMVLPRSVS